MGSATNSKNPSKTHKANKKMHQLQQGDYDLVSPLFSHDFSNKSLLVACVYGEMPSDVFVDDATSPSACIVISTFYQQLYYTKVS